MRRFLSFLCGLGLMLGLMVSMAPAASANHSQDYDPLTVDVPAGATWGIGQSGCEFQVGYGTGVLYGSNFALASGEVVDQAQYVTKWCTIETALFYWCSPPVWVCRWPVGDGDYAGVSKYGWNPSVSTHSGQAFGAEYRLGGYIYYAGEWHSWRQIVTIYDV